MTERKPLPKRLNRLVFNNLMRTAKKNLPSTLTPGEWEETVWHFCNCCAYCGTPDWDTLDHFVPVSSGGGTTRQNCVPACSTCNLQKNELEVRRLPPDSMNPTRIAAIRQYLNERKTA